MSDRTEHGTGMAVAPLDLILAGWRHFDPPGRQPNPDVVARIPRILEVLPRVTSYPGLPAFRVAVERSDAAALSTLAAIHDVLAQRVTALFERAARWKREGAWAALREECELLTALAYASAPDTSYAQCLLLRALSKQRSNDLLGSIADYNEALRVTKTARRLAQLDELEDQ